MVEEEEEEEEEVEHSLSRYGFYLCCHRHPNKKKHEKREGGGELGECADGGEKRARQDAGGCEGGMRVLCSGGIASTAPARGVNPAPEERGQLPTPQRAAAAARPEEEEEEKEEEERKTHGFVHFPPAAKVSLKRTEPLARQRREKDKKMSWTLPSRAVFF
ncbi:hypothetical protein EYF80_061264 [Liparis tanakae]|uniref:Uncharacterized protein n=1 Tax=Liparis tanakae TaxID=230148 RepID=A0A4Z2EIG1_9TELE|nr:hypothetical protein EYF80_061264 [Liparis tanakae]